MKSRVPIQIIGGLLVCVVALLFMGDVVQAQDVKIDLPQQTDVNSLEAIWKNSPFNRKVTPDDVLSPSSSQYALTGVVEIGKKKLVNVFTRATSERVMISDELTNGMRLLEVHYNDNLKEASATIEVNGIKHVIQYDQVLLSEMPKIQPPPVVVGTNAVANPGMPQPMTNNQPPNNMNTYRPGGTNLPSTNNYTPRMFRRSRVIDGGGQPSTP